MQSNTMPNISEANQLIVLRDNAKHELLQIKSVEDGISHLNKLKTIEVWVKAEKKDAELQNIVAEQKLRTQRILGELIKEGQEKGEIASASDNLKSGSELPVRDFGKLHIIELGINHKQSSAFQAIASIPEETFEEFIAEKKQAVNNAVAELTTTGAVRLAKTLEQKRNENSVNADLQKRLSTERELKQLAKEINSKYNAEQKSFLINLINH